MVTAHGLLALSATQSAAYVLMDRARHFSMRASVSRTALAPQDVAEGSRLVAGGLHPCRIIMSGCGQVASHIMFDSTRKPISQTAVTTDASDRVAFLFLSLVAAS